MAPEIVFMVVCVLALLSVIIGIGVWLYLKDRSAAPEDPNFPEYHRDPFDPAE